jgi:hypothetical protein
VLARGTCTAFGTACTAFGTACIAFGTACIAFGACTSLGTGTAITIGIALSESESESESAHRSIVIPSGPKKGIGTFVKSQISSSSSEKQDIALISLKLSLSLYDIMTSQKSKFNQSSCYKKCKKNLKLK